MAIVFSNKNSAFKGKTFEPSFNFYEKNFHKTMGDFLKNAEYDRGIAKELEECFKIIKDPKVYEGSKQNFLEEIKALNIDIKSFKISGGKKFEENFRTNINKISRSYNENNKNIAFMAGEKTATTRLKYTSQDLKDLESIILNHAEKIGNNLIKNVYNNMAMEDKDRYRLSLRQEKVDTSINGEINWELKNIDSIQNFLLALKGRSFSLKNYQRFSYITLGSTQQIRSLSSTISYLNKNITSSDAVKIYAHSLYTNQDKTKAHFNHLKLFFELTGAGLVGKNGKIYNLVDFLIINNPKDNQIKVFSTRAIVKDYLEKMKTSNEIKNKFYFNANSGQVLDK